MQTRRLRDRALDVFALLVTAALVVAVAALSSWLIGPGRLALLVAAAYVVMWSGDRAIKAFVRWGLIR